MCFICFAQEHITQDSIQICYTKRLDAAIGGQDRCITIYFEDSLMFCKRICYGIFTNKHIYEYEYTSKYIDGESSLEEQSPLKQAILYRESRKYAILRHYAESTNYLILDERVEISKSQLDELVKIINEIKAFVSAGVSPDEIIISTASSHYVIKDKNGTTVIVDWHGRYDRSRDIEKVLGLKSYLRCPCVEEDLKQMKGKRKKR